MPSGTHPPTQPPRGPPHLAEGNSQLSQPQHSAGLLPQSVYHLHEFLKVHAATHCRPRQRSQWWGLGPKEGPQPLTRSVSRKDTNFHVPRGRRLQPGLCWGQDAQGLSVKHQTWGTETRLENQTAPGSKPGCPTNAVTSDDSLWTCLPIEGQGAIAKLEFMTVKCRNRTGSSKKHLRSIHR